jgi:hypothetical protein
MIDLKPSWTCRPESELYKIFGTILVADLIGFVTGAIIAIILTYSIAGCTNKAAAAPNRVPEKKQEPPKEEPLPSLIGETNWGTIGQNGSQLIIQGHPHWSATGHINKDGTISLTWVQLSTGTTAPGHYRKTADGTFEGTWGFMNDITVEDDGTLRGETRRDVIRWVEN